LCITANVIVICLVYIVYFSFFSTVAAYMANKVVYILLLLLPV